MPHLRFSPKASKVVDGHQYLGSVFHFISESDEPFATEGNKTGQLPLRNRQWII